MSVVSERALNTGVATERGPCEDHHVRPRETLHWLFYMAGALCLTVGFFGVRQLAIIAIPLVSIGAAFHWRWHRRNGATSACAGTELMDSRIVSRPGLYDRYDGIVTSLTRWED